MTTNTVNSEAAARADRDQAAIQELGIEGKARGRRETFFEHGTELIGIGKKLARRDRKDFLKLPTVVDGMDDLISVVQREERSDHWVDLGGVCVDLTGEVATGVDLDTGSNLTRYLPSETGWQRLASFAPSEVPAGLRTNVNAWTRKRSGDRVRIRTRLPVEMPEYVAGMPEGISPPRELYAVVGTGYVPYDLDAIAADIQQHLPSDARVRVRYDRSRARIDAILHNPHYFPGSGGTATVGEAHRMTLRITTADDGTGGFKIRWSAERIACINLTLLKGASTVFHAKHTRQDLKEMIQFALATQGQVMEDFAAVWRHAWTNFYLDTSKSGQQIDGLEALRRMVFHGLVKIPGMRKPDVWGAVSSAWEAEQGDSIAHVHNAITRAAHTAQTERSWADDEVEEQAADRLYQKVHVLADIPEDDRKELNW